MLITSLISTNFQNSFMLLIMDCILNVLKMFWMCVVGNKVIFKAHQAPGWAVVSGGTRLRGEARLWQWEGWFRQQHWRLLFLLDLKAQACIFLQHVSELNLQGGSLLGCRCKSAVWGCWGVPSPPERDTSPWARAVQGDEGALRDDAALGPE